MQTASDSFKNCGDDESELCRRLLHVLERLVVTHAVLDVDKGRRSGWVPSPPPLDVVMAELGAPAISWDLYRVRAYFRIHGWRVEKWPSCLDHVEWLPNGTCVLRCPQTNNNHKEEK